MRNEPIKHATILALAGLLGVLFLQTSTRAGLVYSGYDLFRTDSGGTSLDGHNYEGVPLSTPTGGPNTYYFDTTYYGTSTKIGLQNVGITDTIMYRTADVMDGTIPLVLAALQLKSVAQFDPDGGGPAPLAYYYITLQSIRPGGTVSAGTVTINSGGTWGDQFDVYYDLRLGAVDGTVVSSPTDPMHMAGSGYWQHDPTANAGPLIPGVNYMLNGLNTANDFWCGGARDPFSGLVYGPITHDAGAGCHTVNEIPEPSTVFAVVFVVAVILLYEFRSWRRRVALACSASQPA